MGGSVTTLEQRRGPTDFTTGSRCENPSIDDRRTHDRTQNPPFKTSFNFFFYQINSDFAFNFEPVCLYGPDTPTNLDEQLFGMNKPTHAR